MFVYNCHKEPPKRLREPSVPTVGSVPARSLVEETAIRRFTNTWTNPHPNKFTGVRFLGTNFHPLSGRKQQKWTKLPKMAKRRVKLPRFVQFSPSMAQSGPTSPKWLKKIRAGTIPVGRIVFLGRKFGPPECTYWGGAQLGRCTLMGGF